MCNFRVGQKVVCIDDKGTSEFWNGFQLARRGTIYTIRSIFYFGEQAVLLFEEIVNPIASYSCNLEDREPGFEADNFRPLVTRKTDISIFKAMLAPKTEQVPA